MAEGVPRPRKGKAKAARADDAPAIALQLPDAMFTGPGLLTLADLLPVMTAFVDRGLVYRFMNKPLADWLGKSRREVIGRTMAEVLGERAFAERQPMVEAALAGERKFFAATFDHPELGAVTAQSDYVPWVNPATGAVDGVVMVIADISDQRATEQALRESEERFRRIANSAPAMMWVTRLDRVRDFVNDAYVDFVGGPGSNRSAAERLDWRTRIHPDDVDRIVAESIAGEASCTAFTLEGRYRRFDGRMALAAERVAAALFGRRGADRLHRGRERHHAGQGGRARAAPPGRGADPRARAVGGAVPGGVRHGARGLGSHGTRWHGRRAQPQGGAVARGQRPGRRRAQGVGHADFRALSRSTSR